MKNKRFRTISYKFHPKGDMPFIVLTGRWFEHCGFTPGDRVEIECKKGEIKIKNLKLVAK